MKNKVLIVCSNYYDEVSSNLIKGASGQAVQNMNILYNFKETEGLV